MAKRYKKITINGKKIDEHRYLMEQALGRKLRKDEVVHHINGDKMDNRIENLQVMSWAEHNKLHSLGRKKVVWTDEMREGYRQVGKENSRIQWKRVVQKDEAGNIIKVFDSVATTAEAGFVPSDVGQCANGTRRTHKGFSGLS